MPTQGEAAGLSPPSHPLHHSHQYLLPEPPLPPEPFDPNPWRSNSPQMPSRSSLRPGTILTATSPPATSPQRPFSPIPAAARFPSRPRRPSSSSPWTRETRTREDASPFPHRFLEPLLERPYPHSLPWMSAGWSLRGRRPSPPCHLQPQPRRQWLRRNGHTPSRIWPPRPATASIPGHSRTGRRTADGGGQRGDEPSRMLKGGHPQ
mmetsp:Transcript_46633/g.141275  ORF Transcript_46633/g.141275 Transcript_46633/m.141275 type:complete len:206 (-) Transcript_46633:3054-3671(-)